MADLQHLQRYVATEATGLPNPSPHPNPNPKPKPSPLTLTPNPSPSPGEWRLSYQRVRTTRC